MAVPEQRGRGLASALMQHVLEQYAARLGGLLSGGAKLTVLAPARHAVGVLRSCNTQPINHRAVQRGVGVEQ